MDLIVSGILEAARQLVTLDPEILRIAALSLAVSGTAVLISMLLGVPLGSLLAMKRFPGRNFIISIVNTGMGLPPVVAGLAVSLVIWRSGPLGSLEIMLTPTAMVIAQVVIASPIVAGLTMTSLQQLDPRLKLQLISLGASPPQVYISLLKEARLPMLAALMAGFGAVISEVGAVMMVGGNIKGETRVLTTAIVTEVRLGNFSTAISLSIILLALTFLVNYALTRIQQRDEA